MNKDKPKPELANLSGTLDPSLYKMSQESGEKKFFLNLPPIPQPIGAFIQHDPRLALVRVFYVFLSAPCELRP